MVEDSRERAARGTSEGEVLKVLLSGTIIPAKKSRKAKEMIFDYEGEWLGKICSQKFPS
jgi:hypothetical protein